MIIRRPLLPSRFGRRASMFVCADIVPEYGLGAVAARLCEEFCSLVDAANCVGQAAADDGGGRRGRRNF
jgi:hypothetical protein